MTAVVDYGAGNLRSVVNALDRIGAACMVTSDPRVVAESDRVILPGVGHFGQMMASLSRLSLIGPLRVTATDGRPFLGICLGMQALYSSSDEAPGVEGLAVFHGRVARIEEGVTTPHMGWNDVASEEPVVPPGWYTFANGYFAPVGPETVATCDYFGARSAAVRIGNAIGVQFHPEKSGALGLRLLENFCGVSS